MMLGVYIIDHQQQGCWNEKRFLDNNTIFTSYGMFFVCFYGSLAHACPQSPFATIASLT